MTAPIAVQAAEGVQSAAAADWSVFGAYSIADPAFLLLLPLGLALLYWGRSRSGRVAGRVSALPAGAVPRSLRQRLAWTPTALQACAIVLSVVALSRPLRGNVEQSTVSQGVDIALVVDRSSSMLLRDLVDDGSATRFDVVKEVVLDFATRRMTDREGNSDNVSLISFALYPEVVCPFTLDVNALGNFMRATEVVPEGGPEDGTAIGVALAKAVAVLEKSDATSKVVVLLTDGENNGDAIAPIDAAELAASKGIRVHTIHAARYVWARGFDGVARPTNDPPPTEELEAIAEKTGGVFFRARDRSRLEDVYAEIERLERTLREDKRFEQNFDLYPFFLEPAIALYLLAWIAGSTWARRLP